MRDIKELLGKTIIEIVGAETGREEIIFRCSDETSYKMYHEQDCCESVTIEDICGDISCLLNSPITMAEDISSDYIDSDPYGNDDWGTHVWTWYKFATIKGYVTIRWYGESNGYYSESVDFALLPDGGDE